jgi:NitT/TauT family transport system substrate-binding protein
LKPSDVEIVNMDPEQVGVSFVAGNIDAGMTWEPWLTKILAETKNGKVLFSSRDYPNIISDDVIVRRDVLEKRREDIKKVMRAYFKAVDYWEKNRTEGNAIVARNFGLTPGEFAPIRDTIKLADYAYNLEKFDKAKANNMYEIMDKAAEIYYQDGVIKTKPDVNKIIDSSLLSEIR